MLHRDPGVQLQTGRARPKRVLWAIPLLVAAAGLFIYFLGGQKDAPQKAAVAVAKPDAFYPTAAQWATLTVEPVATRVFSAEYVTEGKLAVDEDRSTPIYSPYAGRVTKLFVKPGDTVQKGQQLFVIEAADTVQAQNDFTSARTALNKARSLLELSRISEKRARDLYEGKAVPLKDLQQAQNATINAEKICGLGESALEAARNRLRILGRSDAEIAVSKTKGIISPETAVSAPIGGTIVLRKVGPGQYVSGGTQRSGVS